jgi:serine/threonine-protein kinase
MTGVHGSFMGPRISPDGKRLAIQAQSNVPGGGFNVLVYDVATRTPTPLTTMGNGLQPTWTPDGRGIVFMSAGRLGLMVQPVDGSATALAIPGTVGAFTPTVVAPDGRSIVFARQPQGTPWSIWSAPHGGEDTSHQPAHKLVDDGLAHYMPEVSPDGRWLADVSTRNGHSEVFARPYPGPGLAVRVSDDAGGTEPGWSRDGRRIYYRTRGAFMEAVIATTPALAVKSRRELFKDVFDGAMPHRNYDVAPDGSGFIMITGGSSEAVVMEHWLTRLREMLAGER